MNSYFYQRIPISTPPAETAAHCGVLRPVGTSVRETLYFFHAGNGDDRQFLELGLGEAILPELQDQLFARGVQIVLPSVGTRFLQGPSGDYVRDRLIAEMERDVAGASDLRYLSGFSMGGRAALSLFLEHPERYRGIGVQFPTLIDFDYESVAEVRAFQERLGVQDSFLDVLVSGFRDAFPSRAEFLRQDPLRLAQTLDIRRLTGKTIYFDVGGRDEFGLQEGAGALHRILHQRGISHHFDEAAGLGHDAAIIRRNWNTLLRTVLGLS